MSIIWNNFRALKIGTTERPLTFDTETLNVNPSGVLQVLNVKGIGILTQVHGSDIIDIPCKTLRANFQYPIFNLGSADGVVVRNFQQSGSNDFALGIRTADCLPIIIRAGDDVALLHAGWRGLAGNIIESAFEKLDIGSKVPEVWVGPAAKRCCYEVGNEVLEALGIDELESKIDLQDQAVRRIRQLSDSLDLQVVDRCTICDCNFHSFRADNTKLRNFSFITT